VSGNLEAALARPREGALVLPLWWTRPSGDCACAAGPECRHPGKHPLTPRGLDDASSEVAVVEAWWGRWPQANLAERTDLRPHIDIDLREVAQELSQDVALRAQTEVYATPRGGLHIVLAVATPVRTQKLLLADGRPLGDLKAFRSYGVLPPSAVGGKRYRWLSVPEARPLEVEDPLSWLSRLLGAFGLGLATAGQGAGPAYKQLGGVVYEGEGRHNALVSYAGRVWVEGMDPKTLEALLHAVNDCQCRPPLPADEVEEIARHFIERRARRSLPGGPNAGVRIVVGNRPLRDVVDDAWEAVRQRSPKTLFLHGGAVVEVRAAAEGARIVRLDVPGLRGYLDRVADWVRPTPQGERPTLPPREVVEDMLARPQELPLLRGIVGAPVVTAEEGLAEDAGYQATTGLYHHAPGEPVPPVPEHPDATDLLRARQLLGAEWLGDFPFVDAASRAHALAAGLTALLREVIAGPVPLFVVDAPAAGTGKTLLACTLGEVVAGAAPAVMTGPRSEDEWRKLVTSVLLRGEPLAIIDNVKGPLASASLAAVLTATVWRDRLLGRNETVTVPARTVWVVTGNNVELDQEVARRAVWVRLDAQADRPWERAGFRHGDLAQWTRRHRHELLWAFLVLVRHWLACGKPCWEGRPLGSFESWSKVVGGVLAAGGSPASSRTGRSSTVGRTWRQKSGAPSPARGGRRREARRRRSASCCHWSRTCSRPCPRGGRPMQATAPS
jgi:hypothetical protein